MRTDRKKYLVKQALILCGGKGTRLGNLTRKIPKPILKLNSKPFLEYIIQNLVRHGIKEIILLCGYNSSKIFKRFHKKKILGSTIKCVKENKVLGTGGAIINAKKNLNQYFIVCNGDTYFDFNISNFIKEFNKKFHGSIATTKIKNNSRYAKLQIKNELINKIGKNLKSSYINTGYYIFSKNIFSKLKIKYSSLEDEIIQKLVLEKKLQAFKCESKNNFFLDIGVPRDFEKAKYLVPKQFKKKAVFLDRDGVINKDLGYVIEKNNFFWNKGVKQGIKLLNENNYYVFIITNQSGVGRGYFTEKEVIKLHSWINDQLKLEGAHIDYFYYSTYFKFSKIKSHKKDKYLRKPNTGMIQLAKKSWPINFKGSFLIGDKNTDIMVAKKMGIKGYLVNKNYNFLRLIRKILNSKRMK